MAGGSGETLVVSRLTGGKRRLESAADLPFTRLLVAARDVAVGPLPAITRLSGGA